MCKVAILRLQRTLFSQKPGLAAPAPPPAQGLGTLTQLKIVDLSSNMLSRVQGLEGLTQLEDLWLNGNSE